MQTKINTMFINQLKDRDVDLDTIVRFEKFLANESVEFTQDMADCMADLEPAHIKKLPDEFINYALYERVVQSNNFMTLTYVPAKFLDAPLVLKSIRHSQNCNMSKLPYKLLIEMDFVAQVIHCIDQNHTSKNKYDTLLHKIARSYIRFPASDLLKRLSSINTLLSHFDADISTQNREYVNSVFVKPIQAHIKNKDTSRNRLEAHLDNLQIMLEHLSRIDGELIKDKTLEVLNGIQPASVKHSSKHSLSVQGMEL